MTTPIPTPAAWLHDHANDDTPVTAKRIAAACDITTADAVTALRATGWRRAKRITTRGPQRGLRPWVPGDATTTATPHVTPPPSIEALGTNARHRRERNDARRDLDRALRRIDALRDVVSTYERYTAEPLRPVEPVTLREGKRPAVAVALLSDVHAEERVDETDAIPNRYNLAIAERRVARFFAGVVWLTQTAGATFDIGTLVLWLGGDFISGDIHDELLERCEVPPGEAMLTVRAWLAAGISRTLRDLPGVAIRVPCSVGNHGRTTKSMRAATGYGHSWEHVLYRVLAADFRDEPRVSFHVTHDEMQYVRVFDATLAFHHGHRMRYSGGIGGITIPAVKAAFRWDKWRAVDYYHFGHFHTRIDLGQIAFNGSVIGPSPYGFAIGAAPEAPQQSFYVLDAARGKTMASPVWVQPSDEGEHGGER